MEESPEMARELGVLVIQKAERKAQSGRKENNHEENKNLRTSA